MDTIWKYELEVTDTQEILIPNGFEVLAIQTQHGKPCLLTQLQKTTTSKPIIFITYLLSNPINNSLLTNQLPFNAFKCIANSFFFKYPMKYAVYKVSPILCHFNHFIVY